MVLFVIFVICGLQLQVTPTVSQNAVSRASYGDACDSRIRCDSRKHLTCSNGNCTCLLPETMAFDEEQNRCVVLAGERCLYSTKIEEDQTWTDHLICIGNATCKNGICNCNHDHFEVANGTCQPGRQFGEECSTNEMCNTSKNLVCSKQNVCSCDSNSINLNNQCFIPAGQKCTEKHVCVENAVCVKQNTATDVEENQGLCTCQPGYYELEKGKCERMKSFGEVCESSKPCFGNMECDPEQKVCTCSNNTTFYPAKNRCVVNVGFSCNSKTQCTPGAECVNKICKCDSEDWFEMPGYGNCFRNRLRNNYWYYSYYRWCTSDTTGPLTDRICPPGLLCRNNKCQCPFKRHQEYNATTGNCLSLVRGPCEQNSNCFNNDMECVNEKGIKECKCKLGFIGVNRYCKIAYGGQCNRTEPNCDTIAPLECSENGICECGKLQIYDEKVKICRGLVGAMCEPEISTREKLWGPFCVDGAECVRYRASTGSDLASCNCKDGWETQTNRTCAE